MLSGGNNSSRRHDRGRSGRTSKDKTEKTAEELDKEMDSYMNVSTDR